MTRTVAICSQKGGVGKTTVATGLASAARLAGRSVFLLDLDPQESAKDWSRSQSEKSQLAGIRTERMETITRPTLEKLAGDVDVVVIDTPARLGKVMRAAAAVADMVLMPIRPGSFDVWALDRTLGELNKANEVRARWGWAPVPRSFVLTQAPVGANITREASGVIGETGEKLAPVTLHFRVSYTESVAPGETVLTEARSSVAASEMRELYDYAMKRRRQRRAG